MKSKRHPEEFADTDPKAMAVWLKMLRRMSPAERIEAVLVDSQLALQVLELEVWRLFPNASNDEVLRRVAARHLPRETVMQAYGWDPVE